jgi:deoxyhypusine monooxygenase
MVAAISLDELKNLESCLLNTSQDVPLHTRFRALFTLKAFKNEDAVAIISKGLWSTQIVRPQLILLGFKDPSALLKHELAYCLGQMKNTSALPTLEAVLKDTSEDPMVRHEVRFYLI